MKVPQYIVFLILSVFFLGYYRQSDDKRIAEDHHQQQLADAADEEGNKSRHLTNRTHYHTVDIKQMKFDPAELIVRKGDTVVWINNDIVIHDVTEQYGKQWTSSPIPLKKSWQMVVTQSSDYYCSLHVVMKGKLVVE